MPIHKESAAKQTIRFLLLDACKMLGRGKVTYLGLPSDKAYDLMVLEPVLENAICIDESKAILDETRRSIAALPLKEKRFKEADMWQYLRDDYPTEPLTADITFLDFYGGGIRKDDPFAQELAGLRSYFAKHAQQSKKAFILAWTYMPRDKGKEMYVKTCEKIIGSADLARLQKASGVWARTVAIRLLLRQSLKEHGMIAHLFQHAVYKTTMNAIIVLFSKGIDPRCSIPLDNPDTLLEEPVCVYDGRTPVPQMVPFPTAK